MGGKIIDFPEKRIHDEGIQQGIKQGGARGAEQEKLENLRTVMTKMECNSREALAFLNVSAADYDKYIPLLRKTEQILGFQMERNEA